MPTCQCESCGGTFASVVPDGLEYYHACPPITRVRVKRGAAWVEVPLVAVLPTDTIEVRRAGVVVETTVALVQPDDVRLGDTIAERPDRRDEHVVPRRDPAEPRRIKAEGLGVTPMGP